MDREVILSQLYRANRILRRQRPADISCMICEFFQEEDLLEISLPSYRCCHDIEGGCIMCNYGMGSAHRPDKNAIMMQLESLLRNVKSPVRTLLLSTNGSILDQNSIDKELLFEVLEFAENSTAETIIIETHIDTLSEARFQMLRQYIPKKFIIIEVGLESSDNYVQKYCYLKELPMNKLSQALSIAQNYDIRFQLNVIMGAPFLSRREQIKDAEKSIRWSLEKGAMVTLFPMNIKPFTLLRYALEQGICHPISHWSIPLLLERFTEAELERIDLAWYGNRQIEYDDTHANTIFPTDCNKCHSFIQDFYHTYITATNGSIRRAAVAAVLSSANCDCFAREIDLINYMYDSHREERVHNLHCLLVDSLKKSKILN